MRKGVSNFLHLDAVIEAKYARFSSVGNKQQSKARKFSKKAGRKAIRRAMQQKTLGDF